MTGPSHVLSPEGGWLHFDAWDPAGVEAVKDLLTCGNTRDRVQSDNEVTPAALATPGGPADNLLGGVSDG